MDIYPKVEGYVFSFWKCLLYILKFCNLFYRLAGCMQSKKELRKKHIDTTANISADDSDGFLVPLGEPFLSVDK